MKKSLKSMVIGIVMGLMLGSIIGALKIYGIISEENAIIASDITIKLVISAIVLIIDALCIMGLFNRLKERKIENEGKKAVGKIENVIVIPHPSQIAVEEEKQKVRYSLEVSYEINSKKYKKEFPPTSLVGRKDLFPLVIEKGENIPIKYYEKNPNYSLIDIEELKTHKENENSKKYLILIPTVITISYVIALLISMFV